MDHVRSFDELVSGEDWNAGGKGRTLARLYRAKYPVPDGFVVLSTGFVGDEISAASWAKTRQLLSLLRKGDNNTAFAVRSSALVEDSPSASFAGQFETVLGVCSDPEIRRAIRSVRRSRRNERVLAYTRVKGIAPDLEMAVVVQRMAAAEISGVLFSADPVTGSRAEMVGSFVRDLGDRLVSGEATGESFTLERPNGEYRGPAELERYTRRLYRLADRLERELGCPQDIEWALARGKLLLLQSRPITTLLGYDPASGEWNDSLTGDFLWSNVNFGEAVSGVMTPLTWTVIRNVLEDWMYLPGHHSSGNIGGRPYLNLSIFASVFHALGKSAGDLLETLKGTAYTPLPDGMEIPLLPLSRWSALRHLPRWTRIQMRMMKGVRELPEYVEKNPAWCLRARELIQATDSRAKLYSLWHEEIRPHLVRGVWIVLGSASRFADFAGPLRQELADLLGPEDADLLLASPADDHPDLLANLGPMVGVAAVAGGELDRREYLERFGHRGPDEFELSVPRPAEDPDWLDQRLAEFRACPVDVESLLEKQRSAREAAWARFQESHPRKARSLRRRIEKTVSRSRLREAARSEYVRDRWLVRALALRAGELTGLGEEVFFLILDELMQVLSGDGTAVSNITARKETHERYSAVPPYPSVIRGRFDPFLWAADPSRRSDVFDSHAPLPPLESGESSSRTIHGAAGSAGRVEGLVRRLDSPREGHRLELGEVLVAVQTDIEWTLLFPRAAAIVTDVGAPLSHAAIVARELGIPAVVGCGSATMRLHTGDRVIVDGGRGVVQIVEFDSAPLAKC
jgi:pyruvate,water dikinase